VYTLVGPQSELASEKRRAAAHLALVDVQPDWKDDAIAGAEQSPRKNVLRLIDPAILDRARQSDATRAPAPES